MRELFLSLCILVGLMIQEPVVLKASNVMAEVSAPYIYTPTKVDLDNTVERFGRL